MEKTDGITDVGEMKDRMMIDLFKKKLQEAQEKASGGEN
jgi:hypothetical protein